MTEVITWCEEKLAAAECEAKRYKESGEAGFMREHIAHCEGRIVAIKATIVELRSKVGV